MKNLEDITKKLDEERKKNGGLTNEEMYQEVMSNLEDPIYDYTNR